MQPKISQNDQAQPEPQEVLGNGDNLQGANPQPIEKQELHPTLNRGGNTPDNAYGAGAPKSDVRPLRIDLERLTPYGHNPRPALRTAFQQRLEPALELCDRLIEQAQNGKLKTTEIVKLIDVLAKYGLGPVVQQEISGQDGAPVQVNFSFGPAKAETQAYLQDVRQRVAQQLAQREAHTLGPAQAQPLPQQSNPEPF